MKKILALVLSIALSLSCIVSVPTVSAAEDDAVIYADQLELLKALNIVSGINVGSSALSVEVERAEAAMYFCNMLGLEFAEVENFESIFYDLTSEHPYYSYIKTIYSAGYMRGDGDGRFRPDDTISVMEAANVVTSLVGYRGYTAVKGIDYVIRQTGVLDGISVENTVTLEQLLRMFYNILHAPACQVTGYGNEVSFLIDDDYLGIEMLFNVKKGYGVVDKVENISLSYNQSNLRDNMISINRVPYAYSKDAMSVLGYSVDFYYKKNATYKDIIYMKPSNKNNTKVLTHEDLISYSNFVFKYWEGNSQKTISIAPDTSILYNGAVALAPSNADFVPRFGQVTFIDNDDDKKFEVVNIENSEFYLVDNVNPVDKKIYDVTPGTVLDCKDADDIKIYKDGYEYSFDLIRSGDLLKVNRSKADSAIDVVNIEVYKDAKYGAAITSVDSKTVTVLGEKLKIWPYMDATSKGFLKTGELATIYVCDGYAIRAEGYATGNYAYLIDLHQEDASFQSGDVQFMVKFNGGDLVILEMAKNLYLDGTPYKSSDFATIKSSLQTSALISAGAQTTYPYAQPIKYTLSKTGKLDSIDTFYFDAAKEDAETSLRRLEAPPYYRSNATNGLYETVGEEKVLKAIWPGKFTIIPKDVLTQAEYYTQNTPSDGGNYSAIDICNVDSDTLVAEEVYYYRAGRSGASGLTYTVVDKYQEMNTSGDIVTMLTLAYTSVAETFECLPDVIGTQPETLAIGDVISMDLNNNSKVSSITRQYSCGTIPDIDSRVFHMRTVSKNSTKNPPYADGERLVYGTPIKISSGNMLFTPSIASDMGGVNTTYKVDNMVLGDVPVWKYSIVRGMAKVEKVSINDIISYNVDPQKASQILVDIRGSKVSKITIYER